MCMCIFFLFYSLYTGIVFPPYLLFWFDKPVLPPVFQGFTDTSAVKCVDVLIYIYYILETVLILLPDLIAPILKYKIIFSI